MTSPEHGGLLPILPSWLTTPEWLPLAYAGADFNHTPRDYETPCGPPWPMFFISIYCHFATPSATIMPEMRGSTLTDSLGGGGGGLDSGAAMTLVVIELLFCGGSGMAREKGYNCSGGVGWCEKMRIWKSGSSCFASWPWYVYQCVSWGRLALCWMCFGGDALCLSTL